MQYIRKAETRGSVDLGWLKSNHSFSFGHYYDPKHMGVSALRVINDDVVKPGMGFDTHGHRDMEIISYVIRGALEHKDSEGNEFIIPAGDIQLMSAGSGIYHSEYNASKTNDVNFLQIWVVPQSKGTKPRYQQKTIKQIDKLTPLVTPNGESDSLTINQDASVYRLVLKQGQTITLTTEQRRGYLHVVKGALSVDGKLFGEGDAFALENNQEKILQANDLLEALWFDLP